MAKAKPAKFVIIKKAWVEKYALEGLFHALELQGSKHGAEILVASPAEYNLADGCFAELAFTGKIRKVLIPKDQIVTLFEVETKEDAEAIGFKVP